MTGEANLSVDMPLPDGRHLEATVTVTVTPSATGGPAVVFEAGMGAGQHTWALVAPAVAEHTRVVTYNRAGIGASTPDPRPRTIARAAADLLALVDHLDAAPAVLVGHSYGGPIVREALAAAPDRVAGLVLVDPTDEGCDLFFAPDAQRQQRAFAALLPLLGRTGLLRLFARSLARVLPPDARRAVAAESGTPAAARTHRQELVACDADLRRLRDDPHPPPDVPLTIISGTRRARSHTTARRRDCLVAAHERRATEAPKGRHVHAERSEHLPMLTEPDLVTTEILRLVDGG